MKKLITITVISLMSIFVFACGDSNASIPSEYSKGTANETGAPSDVNTSSTELASSDDTDFDAYYDAGFIDAKKYYQEHGQLLEKINSSNSSIMSEKEAIKEFEKRGFTDLEIVYNYNASGDYIGEKYAENTSDEKHPQYSSLYISPSGNLFNIYISGNVFVAGYLGNTNYKVEGINSEVILAEQDSAVGYDSMTNCFYVFVPNEDAAILKNIGSIDSNTLDNFDYAILIK